MTGPATAVGGAWAPLSVDVIVDLEPGQQASGLANVPSTLTVFDTHFPRFPVVPGVLVLDALVTLGVRLLVESAHQAEAAGDGVTAWRLARAGGIRYRHYVRPGDQLRLHVELQRDPGPAATLRGSAAVEDCTVTTVRTLRLVPATVGPP